MSGGRPCTAVCSACAGCPEGRLGCLSRAGSLVFVVLMTVAGRIPWRRRSLGSMPGAGSQPMR